jgi:hypothetical protein
LWQTREGKELGRLPFIEDFKGNAKKKLNSIVDQLDRLRSKFNELVASGQIRTCNCEVPGCPVIEMSEVASKQMDLLRTKILDDYRSISPEFDVQISIDD